MELFWQKERNRKKLFHPAVNCRLTGDIFSEFQVRYIEVHGISKKLVMRDYLTKKVIMYFFSKKKCQILSGIFKTPSKQGWVIINHQ